MAFARCLDSLYLTLTEAESPIPEILRETKPQFLAFPEIKSGSFHHLAEHL
jgi:hypothetical protein